MVKYVLAVAKEWNGYKDVLFVMKSDDMVLSLFPENYKVVCGVKQIPKSRARSEYGQSYTLFTGDDGKTYRRYSDGSAKEHEV